MERSVVQNYRDTQLKIVKRARTVVTGDENKRIRTLLKKPVRTCGCLMSVGC